MRWIRSWPSEVPPVRAYVADTLPRLMVADYDYAPALAHLDESVCLLEWDVALELVDMERFAQYAALHPDRVLVAAYRLYQCSQPSIYPQWAHRRIEEGGGLRWALPRDTWCDYFSFGCIYLPRDVVKGFLSAEPGRRGRPPEAPDDGKYPNTRMTDETFSRWHRHWAGLAETRVPIVWDVRPVHLHW